MTQGSHNNAVSCTTEPHNNAVSCTTELHNNAVSCTTEPHNNAVSCRRVAHHYLCHAKMVTQASSVMQKGHTIQYDLYSTTNQTYSIIGTI